MEIIKPKVISNGLFSLAGAAILAANFFRHKIFGYRTPRPFPLADVEKVFNYETAVVRSWEGALVDYVKSEDVFGGKTVLELGPGADFGTGLLLLVHGAKRYIAFDTFDLAKRATGGFYDRFFQLTQASYPDADIAFLNNELKDSIDGKSGRIRYIVDKDFSVSKIGEKADIILSNAAFEHFADAEKVISELGLVSDKRCVFISTIDLMTHTRWIRELDPLNIYRYGGRFWNMLKFKGSPNRTRLAEYKTFLAKSGWSNVKVKALSVLDDSYIDKVIESLDERFRNYGAEEMKILSATICASKDR